MKSQVFRISIMIVTVMLLFTINRGSAQTCTPVKQLNISTGIDANAHLIAFGSNDPFWKYGQPQVSGIAIDHNSVASNWNQITNTRVLSPQNNNKVTGSFKYKRSFFVCENGEIKFEGVFRDDNRLRTFKVYKVGNTAPIWTFNSTAINSVDPQSSKDIPFNANFSATVGEYYIEFEYYNMNDGIGFGGFALQGTLSSKNNMLSNTINCCCNCSILVEKPIIQGTNCLCKSRECSDVLKYNIDVPESLKNCLSYTWTITPVIPLLTPNQSQISINCKDLVEGKSYTIKLVTKCGTSTRTSTKTLTVCTKIDASFSTSMTEKNLKAQASSNNGVHFWSLVKDDNGDCKQNTNEVAQNISNSTTAQFNNLIPNQQYILYHTTQNRCGKACLNCLTTKRLCFKWLPTAMMRKKEGPTGSMEKINEEEVEENQIPEGLLKLINQ